MSKPKALSMLKKLGMGQLLGPKSNRPSLWFITSIYHVGFCEEMFKRKEQFSEIFLCLLLLRRQVLLGFAHGAWAFYIEAELLTWGLGFQDFEPGVFTSSTGVWSALYQYVCASQSFNDSKLHMHGQSNPRSIGQLINLWRIICKFKSI